MIRSKLYELFEVSWLMMRQNPGGKSSCLQGFLLGFTGTVDVTKALNSDKIGRIKIKVGGGETQLKEVDFSGTDPSELTPNDAVDVLEAAGFEDCEFSVDSETKRLKVAPVDSNVRFIQIYGDLAAALNFGNCKLNEGKGLYLFPSMDGDLKTAAETEEWAEDKVIENDSPLGKAVKYTIPGKRGGTQVVLTDRLSSREAKQMVNGGTWIVGNADRPEVYEPPVETGGDTRKVDVFTYSKILEKYDNTEGDEKYVRERMYIGGTGHMTRTGGAGSFNDSEYTLKFASYIGDDGKEHASPMESDYTQAQYEALGLSGIIEMDWEDGMAFEDEGNIVTPPDPPSPPPLPELDGTVEITGNIVSGESLTAVVTPTTLVTGLLTYKWMNDVNETLLEGSGEVVYELTDDDIDRKIFVIVSLDGYSGNIVSDMVGPIEEKTPVIPPDLEGDVEITGDLLVGETLTADITLLEGTGTPHFSWHRSDDDITFEPIAGSDNATYELTSDDADTYIKVIVSREGYNGEIESASVGPIEVGP